MTVVPSETRRGGEALGAMLRELLAIAEWPVASWDSRTALRSSRPTLARPPFWPIIRRSSRQMRPLCPSEEPMLIQLSRMETTSFALTNFSEIGSPSLHSKMGAIKFWRTLGRSASLILYIGPGRKQRLPPWALAAPWTGEVIEKRICLTGSVTNVVPPNPKQKTGCTR